VPLMARAQENSHDHNDFARQRHSRRCAHTCRQDAPRCSDRPRRSEPGHDRGAGGSDADGAWQQRDSFEALEAAITLTAHELTSRCDGASAIRTLEAITRELPTHTVRSEDQIEYQQFSTPPALAMLAIQLARLTSDDVFLEPSAGTGIIASLARPHVAI
jgi:hypothetical protein